MSETRPRFQDIQYRFAAFVRNPVANPPSADVEARRMRIYADLFYNNMKSFLAGGFPVLYSLYAESDWDELVRGFYAQHLSLSPQFYQIGGEFLDYLQNEHQPRDCDPPFLQELAHYEWVEMILAIDPAEPDWGQINPDGDLLRGCPVVTPWLHNLVYAFDVQRIGPGYRPETAPEQPTHLAVYRRLDDDIRFVELNALTSGLLQSLIDSPKRSGQQQLQELAESTGQDAQQLLGFGADLLADMREKQLLLGTRSG